MKPLKIYNNILHKPDPLDLHPRTLNGDWSQKGSDQLQMTSDGRIKIRVNKPRIK